MEQLLSFLSNIPEYNQILAQIRKGSTAAITGIDQINRSHLAAGISSHVDRPVVLICQDELTAKRMQQELAAFLGFTPPNLPIRDLTLYDTTAVSRNWEHQRLQQLHQLRTGETRLQILTWEALSQRTVPPQILDNASFTLSVGMEYPADQLPELLTRAGYSRCDMVEGTGQFAIRGGIVDIFSPAAPYPIRAELFGDEVDTMGYFDPATQRRVENIEEALILPVAETLPAFHPSGVDGLCNNLTLLIAQQRRRKTPHEPLIQTLTQDLERLTQTHTHPAADRYMSLIYPTMATAMDYVPENAVIILCDQSAVHRTAHNRAMEMGYGLDSMLQKGILCGELCDFICQWDDFCNHLREKTVIYMDAFAGSAYPDSCPPRLLLPVIAKQLPGYGGSLDTAASDLAHYQRQKFSALVLCGSRQRALMLQEMLEARNLSSTVCVPLTELPGPGQIYLTDGSLPNGMEYPAARLAVLTEGQLVAKSAPRKKTKSATNHQKLNSFTDLSPGDLVVHEQYGIGRFVGMQQMGSYDDLTDYIKIAYAGSDVLYVPATQLDLVSKYIGSNGENAGAHLNSLSGTAWQKAKAKAKKAAQEMAGKLIQLYAARKRLTGYAFSPDNPWQTEFEDNFPYPETDDQLRCIAEIKSDMESTVPMDRLLCGDVGFGKTEVALRAAMKAIMDGKQVAILVPTTVLAQQHYQTALARFHGFPVNVDVLSRFRSSADQKRTLQELRAGNVDLIIGTHKLLQKSVVFKDLGLLIVDEEQRFGVTHKERLKEISRNVDVLTLSATPIPRTLNMALSGIRDMSVLEEPPSDRYPVQTFVMEHNDAIIDDAIRREIGRGGQVYYLYNRVGSIDYVASAIQRRNPDITVAVAHGQMGENALGDVMHAMSEGQIQVLVCTTIIETGLDIPNANTLIIEDADRLGLSQLHQLRGRVGRSTRHAYAYFTYRPEKSLSEVAEKRLATIRDFAEFGSGFKIAMRDLEIRGAGNLLGAEQSGHMLSVGYDMYLKLLDDAVLEEQGKSPRQPDCTADLNISANIPTGYVSRCEERMDLYRRMAAIRSQEDADDLLDEIVDRYGEPSRSVLNLIDVALLRANAKSVGMTVIRQRDNEVYFQIPTTPIPFQGLHALEQEAQYRNRIRLSTNQIPTLVLTLRAGTDPLRQCKQFMAAYLRCCPQEEDD